MEHYPPELRSAPCPVAALLRLPALHSELAAGLSAHHVHCICIADDAASADYPPEANEHKPLDVYPTLVAQGILKRNWMEKRCKQVPSVLVVLFEWEEEDNWKAVESSVGNRIDRVKHNSRHRGTRILCVRVHRKRGRIDEREEKERMSSFRRRADLESNNVTNLVVDSMASATTKLAQAIRDLSKNYYRDEGRRLKNVKSRLSKATQPALYIRVHFKIAFHDEMRASFLDAVKNYTEAYRHLREMYKIFTGVFAMEAKTIAEFLNYKLCATLLRLKRRGEAIAQFKQHLRMYKGDVAPLEVEFEHWSWVSRQYRVFGELLEALPGAAAGGGDRWQWPGLYYHAAAKFSARRRDAAQSRCSLVEADEAALRPAWGEYFGQFAIRQLTGSDDELFTALTVAEKVVHHGDAVVEMLGKAYEQFKRRKQVRMIHFLVSDMAQEYYRQAQFDKAKKLFDTVSTNYRDEKWWSVLATTLRRTLDCSKRLALGHAFVECVFAPAIDLSLISQADPCLWPGRQFADHTHKQL